MPRETQRPRAAALAAVTLAALLLAAGGALAKIDIGDDQVAEHKTPKITTIVKHDAQPTSSKSGSIQLAEIDFEDSPPPRPKPRKASGPVVQVQCWQEGVKIIDVTGLDELTLSNILPRVPTTKSFDGDALGLKGRDGEGGKFLIVPVRDATCLVRDVS